MVVDELKIDEDLITKVLDEEELPRVEKTDNATLVVVDCPYWDDHHVKNKYHTYYRKKKRLPNLCNIQNFSHFHITPLDSKY